MAQTGEDSQTAQLSVSSVQPEELDFVWLQVRPMIHRGLRHGAGDTVSEAEIYTDILEKRMELWAVHLDEEVIAVVVLQILEREAGRALVVVLVAGRNFWSWSEKVQNLISEYGALIGAYTIEAVARGGMSKWLDKMGWHKKAVIMELKNGR